MDLVVICCLGVGCKIRNWVVRVVIWNRAGDRMLQKVAGWYRAEIENLAVGRTVLEVGLFATANQEACRTLGMVVSWVHVEIENPLDDRTALWNLGDVVDWDRAHVVSVNRRPEKAADLHRVAISNPSGGRTVLAASPLTYRASALASDSEARFPHGSASE